jgi:hypothetical protein
MELPFWVFPTVHVRVWQSTRFQLMLTENAAAARILDGESASRD